MTSTKPWGSSFTSSGTTRREAACACLLRRAARVKRPAPQLVQPTSPLARRRPRRPLPRPWRRAPPRAAGRRRRRARSRPRRPAPRRTGLPPRSRISASTWPASSEAASTRLVSSSASSRLLCSSWRRYSCACLIATAACSPRPRASSISSGRSAGHVGSR